MWWVAPEPSHEGLAILGMRLIHGSLCSLKNTVGDSQGYISLTAWRRSTLMSCAPISQPGVTWWLAPQLLSTNNMGASFTVMHARATRGLSFPCNSSHLPPGQQLSTPGSQ
mmetsp:Transcript_23759/g.32371  ORF Transcript_23759/g.32371 Transcript_23759/m.32371 type:complete len:111 (+) Transcript_23759:2-334(+)